MMMMNSMMNVMMDVMVSIMMHAMTYMCTTYVYIYIYVCIYLFTYAYRAMYANIYIYILCYISLNNVYIYILIYLFRFFDEYSMHSPAEIFYCGMHPLAEIWAIHEACLMSVSHCHGFTCPPAEQLGYPPSTHTTDPNHVSGVMVLLYQLL